jgi:hypothetical protein
MVALQEDGQMGYASPATVRGVIGRFRDQGSLPQPLNRETILRIGVTESLAPRTIQTLKLLGLIDDQGKVTEQFERLRRAPTNEFKPELVSMLRSAYAPVFEAVEPAGATYEQIQDAFRTFKPEGQRARMVALFLGLLEYAEYSQDLPASGRGTGPSRTTGATTRQRSVPKKDKPSDRENNVNRDDPPAAPPRRRDVPTEGDPYLVELSSGGKIFALVDVDLFGLSVEDRNYVIDLVDKLKGYKTPGVTHAANEEELS